MSRAEAILNLFKGLTDWEDRYKKLIELGKALPEMPESFKNEDYKVKGCQSQVWLYPEFKNGIVHFHADSDALLVKGLIALLLMFYNDLNTQDILSLQPDFIKELELESHLTPSRANGLVAMIKQIKFYAIAFQHQSQTT